MNRLPEIDPVECVRVTNAKFGASTVREIQRFMTVYVSASAMPRLAGDIMFPTGMSSVRPSVRCQSCERDILKTKPTFAENCRAYW